MTDKAESKVMGGEEKRLKRKQSLEASVTLGLGHGKKKRQNVEVEAFYSVVWPVLEGVGWTLVNAEGDDAGVTYFLPPGVTMGNKGEDEEQEQEEMTHTWSKSPAPNEDAPWDCCDTNGSEKSRCTGRKRLRGNYFRKVRDVIERVLEKKNTAEAMAADAYLEIVPDASDIFTDKEEKSEPSCPSRQRHNNNHFSWKDERTHFEKSSSRVGPDFQVDVLPAAGSHTSNAGDLYERVWDPEEAEKLGKNDFVHTRVKFNQKEAAYDIFHSRGYRLPGFYQEVSSISPTDASDWTKDDKDRFRAAVFEYHENMKEVSAAIGKPTNECITHYLVKFKRTKSYKSLTRSMRRKAKVTEGIAGILVCNDCQKGGMLIACDICEAHYHLGCNSPPLKSIPDGSWCCVRCKRETRSMLSSQDEVSCGTDQHPTHGSMEGSGYAASNGSGEDRKIKLDSEVRVEGYINEGKLDLEDVAAEVSGDNQKRKFVSEAGSTQGETDTKSEQTKLSSGYKRIRMDETNVATCMVPV